MICDRISWDATHRTTEFRHWINIPTNADTPESMRD
jgi:hypothetical protein